MRNVSIYLRDIVEAMEMIERFVDDMEFSDFKSNELVSSAVIRKLEVIGEAVKQIPAETRNRASNVPWKEMAGMRDRLIHFYFGIEYSLIWYTIKDVIPNIKPVIQELIENTP
jgi:uncharacterized protein with HEPN domain